MVEAARGEKPSPKSKDILQKKEVTQLAVSFFNEDAADIFEKVSKSGETIHCRCLLWLNPEDPTTTPLLIVKPAITLQNYNNIFLEKGWKESLDPEKSADKVWHSDIYCFWKRFSEENPGSERAKLFSSALQSGGYPDLTHGYFDVSQNQAGELVLNLNSGWYDLTYSTESTSKLVVKMNDYGFDEINRGFIEGKVKVGKLILEAMLGPTIEANAQKLSQIITPRAVRQYRNLAFRFLTNEKPNTSSKAYQIFREYQELLESYA